MKEAQRTRIAAKLSYSMRYACSNCGHKFTRDIPRGKQADKAWCPHCGCLTATKVIGGYGY